jgi:hypothetical protein
MLIISPIVRQYILSVFLVIYTMDSQAELPSVPRPTFEQVRLAIMAFRQCVKSKESLVTSADHEICGVTAENRTELRDYLPCLARRNSVYSRALESYPLGGRY